MPHSYYPDSKKVTNCACALLQTAWQVDCDSFEFRRFRAVDLTFMLLYLSLPFVWLLLLCRRRSLLDPKTYKRGKAPPPEAAWGAAAAERARDRLARGELEHQPPRPYVDRERLEITARCTY